MQQKLVSLLVVGTLLIATSSQARKVLVFGGNGLLGSETVNQFLLNRDDVYIVNRGNIYWDSEERIYNRVKKHIKCDRQRQLSSCSELVELVQTEEKFDAVIDFSAYKVYQVAEATSILANKTELYILISTDSVYDLSQRKYPGEIFSESDSIDLDHVQAYSDHSYAINKLNAEKELKLQSKRSDGIPYVILRLPDVIGPRDGTHRWWMYQLWLKLSSEIANKTVQVPQFLENYDISLVYSPDVGKLIFSLLDKTTARNEVYNLAWKEIFNLRKILETVKQILSLQGDVEIENTPREDPRQFFMYPSARCGALDVRKAYRDLRWQPTESYIAFRETVNFYERAMRDNRFRTQMDEVIQMLGNEIMRHDNKTVMYLAIQKLYGISLNQFLKTHDEL